jgi:hypothetical protein
MAQVVLGFLILWQILFLFTANIVRGVQDMRSHLVEEVPALEEIAPEWSQGEGRVYDALEGINRAAVRWWELTSQPQEWALFAPNVGSEADFVALELRWDDDPPQRGGSQPIRPPEILLSDNEPRDPHRFFRFGNFRLRRFESSFNGERLRKYWKKIRAYMEWRFEAYQRQHPDAPRPKQFILLTRTYRIPAPPGPTPWTWEPAGGPEQRPLARWRPGYAEPGCLPLEKYDPETKRFERVAESD